jgi:RNA polymerase sigma factor (sigma-70 family)
MTFPAFEKCEPLLWRVLADLARRGFVLPPDEARDVMHDFYTSEWARLEGRFDPSKGKPENYVYLAFYRFARPRIVRLRNWRGRLRDIRQLLDCPDPTPGPEEGVAASEEVARVRRAIARLPEPDLRIVSDFLFSGNQSERMLAQRHALSRYEVRKILVSCFARLAQELLRNPQESLMEQLATVKGKLTPDDLDHWMVLATWGEGHSASAAAAVLGTSEERVRSAQRKYVRNLIASLRRASSA